MPFLDWSFLPGVSRIYLSKPPALSMHLNAWVVTLSVKLSFKILLCSVAVWTFGFHKWFTLKKDGKIILKPRKDIKCSVFSSFRSIRSPHEDEEDDQDDDGHDGDDYDDDNGKGSDDDDNDDGCGSCDNDDYPVWGVWPYQDKQ